MNVHMQHLLLGVGGPLLLLALLGWHLHETAPARGRALRGWLRGLAADARAVDLDMPTLPDLEPLRSAAEVAEVADKTQWLGEMTAMMRVHDDLGGGQLVEELPDDAVPVDMAALMVEQDIEEGREFVRWVEDLAALETAVSFGYIRLEGASR